MNKIPTWAVLAALIINENNERCHYGWLTGEVQATDLSDLGRTGTTPKQTVKTILLKKTINGEKLFLPCGEGDYILMDEESTKKISEVENAFLKIAAIGNYSQMLPINPSEKIDLLKKEIAELRKKLRMISEIANIYSVGDEYQQYFFWGGLCTSFCTAIQTCSKNFVGYWADTKADTKCHVFDVFFCVRCNEEPRVLVFMG